MIDFIAVKYAAGLQHEDPLLIVAALLKYELAFKLGKLCGLGGTALLVVATNVMLHTVFSNNLWLAYVGHGFCSLMVLYGLWLFKGAIINRQEFPIERQLEGQSKLQQVSPIYSWKSNEAHSNVLQSS